MDERIFGYNAMTEYTTGHGNACYVAPHFQWEKTGGNTWRVTVVQPIVGHYVAPGITRADANVWPDGTIAH